MSPVGTPLGAAASVSAATGTSRVYFDQLSRIDFDDYYEPSDFVDRAYGDIDGSAAGGEVL